MLTKPITFEHLPQAVEYLIQQQEELRRLILSKKEETETPPENKLLTSEEAAEFLTLAVPTIYTLVSRGELPYMKRGKRIYFYQDELKAYLKAGHRKGSLDIK